MLYEAVKNHNVDGIVQGLEAGEDLFKKSESGISPFELCCLMGDSSVRNVVFHHIHKEKKGKKKTVK